MSRIQLFIKMNMCMFRAGFRLGGEVVGHFKGIIYVSIVADKRAKEVWGGSIISCNLCALF